MKNKWIVIVILLAILVINPNKKGELLNFIGKNDVQVDNTKKIDIEGNYKSVIYDKTIVYYNGKTIKNIDSKGNSLFEININSKNNILGSNKYIDILDKENNTVYSINKNGKILFKKSVPRNGIVYKSLRDDLYVYAYKKDTKNILNIYDNDYTLINSIELEGAITDIDVFNNYIYVVELNTEGYLGSNIYKYDYNGNLKKSKSIDESIAIGLDINKDKITLISNNSVENIDSNLDIKSVKEIKDIKYYSNIYEDSMYIVQENDSINLVSDKVKKFNLDGISPKGIINNGDNSIVYDDNKVITTKNKVIKTYNDTIESIDYIKENMYLVNLDGYIEIIELK